MSALFRRIFRVDPAGDLFERRTGERLRKLFSPRWVANRLAVTWYQVQHPDHPWLTRDAIDELQRYLRKDHRGLELGSGRGTLWIAQRCAGLISVEHDVTFHARALEQLQAAKLTNVDLRLVREKEYLDQVAKLPDASLDFVVLDGIFRGEALSAAWPKLKPGGLLVFDDVQWYLPSDSQTPHARPIHDGPDESIHPTDFIALQAAPMRWTSDGTRDTAVITKPVS